MEKYNALSTISLKELHNNYNLLMKSVSKKEVEEKQKKEKKEKWELYTMEGCIFCEKAKNLLNKRKEKYPKIKIKIEVGIDENGNEDRDLMIKMKKQGHSDYSTWPRIFFNDEFIGGYSDLEKFLKKLK